MEQRKYIERICDDELTSALEVTGAVLIEGPKWCGKTSTARNAAKSVIYLQDPDRSISYLALADTKPSLLLKGETPRLIDEWQMAPVLWDAIRFEVDQRGEQGQFILTGSAVPIDLATAHTGIGRIARFKMRPMSLFESNESNGTVSLQALFDGLQNEEGITSTLTIEKLAFALCRGGWPAAVKVASKSALRMATDYVEAVIYHDLTAVDGVTKNPDLVRLILRSLSRNISNTANYPTLLKDIEAQDVTVSEKTIATYISALKRIFLIEDLPAWQPSVRSKSAIRTSDKRHFVDPSIATAVMRLDPEGLITDFNYFGFLFESLCTRDLRIYAQSNDGEVFHYRDNTGLEVDLIVRLKNGKWGAVEVKMGQKEIEKAAKQLLALKEKINTQRMGEPSFLLILTAGEYGYLRPDGIWVVPIGALKN